MIPVFVTLHIMELGVMNGGVMEFQKMMIVVAMIVEIVYHLIIVIVLVVRTS